jgi:hypothetical protein
MFLLWILQGLELAETAIAEASSHLASCPDLPSQEARARIKYSFGDFFAHEAPGGKGYDMAIDHTFFCAIQ